MDALGKPLDYNYRQLITDCANDYSMTKTDDRKNRILSSLDQLETVANEYDVLADSESLEKLKAHSQCGSALKKDLMDLYTSKFVPEGRPGRNTYMSIRKSAKKGRCPLCSQLDVSTLDHYLPKAKYPAFSIYPNNLVPSCTWCNEHKLANDEALTLHPYYDNIEDIHWLKCVLMDGEAVSVRFDVWESVKPSSLRQRMANHLLHVGVAELYTTSALTHLSDIRKRLCDLGSSGGSAAVLAHLQEELASRRNNRLNSWGTALYFALCSENWFVQGGYVRIEHD